MNKSQRRRLRQPKKNTDLFFLFIQLVIISPIIMVWLYTIFTVSEPFLSNNEWQEFSKIPIFILTIIFGLTFVKIGIKDISDFLVEHTVGVLLLHVAFLFVIALLLSAMINLIFPVSATQLFGNSAELIVQGEKEFRKPVGRDNRCFHYLNMQSHEMNGSICINESLFNSLPAHSFSIKVTGRQSQFGFIIKKMQNIDSK